MSYERSHPLIGQAVRHYRCSATGYAYSTNLTQAAGSWVFPMLIPAGVSFDRIGTYIPVTTGGTPDMEFGIYKIDPLTCEPSDLIYNGGSLAWPGAAGFHEVTIDWTCHDTGWYGIAAAFDTGFTARLLYDMGCMAVVPGTLATPLYGQSAWGWQSGGTTLADPFVFNATYEANGPAIFMRVNRGTQFMQVPPDGERLGVMTPVLERYFTTPGGADLSTSTIVRFTSVAQHLYAQPVRVQVGCMVEKISTPFDNTGAPSGNFHHAIYDAKDDGSPGRLIYTGPTTAIPSGQATSTDTINMWLEPGLYWFGAHFHSGSSGEMRKHHSEMSLFTFDPAADYPTPCVDLNIGSDTSPSSAPTPSASQPIGCGQPSLKTPLPPQPIDDHFREQDYHAVPPLFHCFIPGAYVGPFATDRTAQTGKVGIPTGTSFQMLVVPRIMTIDRVQMDKRTNDGGASGRDIYLYECIEDPQGARRVYRQMHHLGNWTTSTAVQTISFDPIRLMPGLYAIGWGMDSGGSLNEALRQINNIFPQLWGGGRQFDWGACATSTTNGPDPASREFTTNLGYVHGGVRVIGYG